METSLIVKTTSNKKNARWWFVVLILIGAIVNYLDRSNLAIANPLIAKEYNLSPLQMGVLMSAFLWPYALANLPAGWLVDRFGPKKMFGWACGLWSAVTIASAFTTNFSTFYILRMLLGVSESPFFPAGVKAIDRWFTKEDRGTPIAVINTGSQIANGIAPPLLTLLMLTYSWKIMFIIVGVAGFVVLALWLLFYRDPETSMGIVADKQENNQKSLTASKEKEVKWGDLFKYKSTWYMIIGNFGLVYTMWVYLTWLPGYLVTGRGLSILKTGWIAAIPFLVGIIGVPLGGIISDYFIRTRGYAPIRARKIPLVCGAVVAAIAVLPVPYVSDLNTCVALLSLGYFSASLPTGVMWTLATDVAPKNMVASLGSIQNFGGFIGAALAPIITGAIVQATGSFEYVFAVGSALLIVSAISYGVFLKKPIVP